ncbi:hypothetical protein PQ469_24090 [Mucilaginibacter sp. KACC 22773]|uniref:hypothetical protein n=1 Tax=Mucilaginibacter sp. KACC 22773 TaxID=3025671 RepID=UPI00236513F0|nr:hypothetical protein [Mucilaginibacter sp. KACC 22773]WDF76968.1 hypothetical protein PQ469_24090 [Mucilaginibacter sp. KACC 22773]
MLHTLKLLLDGIDIVTKIAKKSQPALPQLEPALYVRRATSISQYIDIATKAMVNDGKKVDDVKTILINRGLHEDHFDAVLNRAQYNYKVWFNETGGKPALTVFELYQQSTQRHAKPSVEIISHKGEDHALHFCALIGFRRYFLLPGRSVLYTIVNQALLNAPVLINEVAGITQSTFAKVGGKAGNPYLRVVTIGQQREAVYPYIQTEFKTLFYTQQIVEWDDGEPIIEAEIEGNLNRTVPVSFFATDYAVNKQIYQTQPNVEVRLSALVLELFEADTNTNEINQQPKGFWANNKYSNKSYFSFEAVILEIKGAPVDPVSIGCMMMLKLDRGQKTGSDFVIDTYITNNNIKADQIRKGMLARGILWFQGEIVR